MTFKTRRITALSLRIVEESEFSDDNDHPSLPPMPVVETTGKTVSEHIRPLSKTTPRNVLAFPSKRRVG